MMFTQKQLIEAYYQCHAERQAESDIAWQDARELEKLTGLSVVPHNSGGDCAYWAPHNLRFYMQVTIEAYGSDGTDWYKQKVKEAADAYEKQFDAEFAEFPDRKGVDKIKKYRQHLYYGCFDWVSSQGNEYRVNHQYVDRTW